MHERMREEIATLGSRAFGRRTFKIGMTYGRMSRSTLETTRSRSSALSSLDRLVLSSGAAMENMNQ